ncbi:MAG: peptidoglycan DD-metalloendopeptidase family protein, partial [Candidatus Latescibacteria bacterium]|nr:peptidoglycan DD-metalloendopeptidase family protein [bacterium]MBD3424048.1 peptidoglycan DD-metalloendopeptidase family protein [Candidatus Latescibacterota bacterium]
MRVYFYKLILILMGVIISGEAAGEGYLWPMPGKRKLSSTFFEFREGHVHAGIDIRSFGQMGLPCYAVDDGYVERVKVQPYGYGKALYLRLSDGNTAVYAHLYGFSFRLDSLVYARRTASRSSWTDIHLPRGQYSFRAGDILAYTGSSGTRAPHLHFELRDSRGNPFNPLIGSYSVPDY